MKKPIIGLNGPPRCGKTFIMGKLREMIPHATPIAIQDGLFEMCVAADPILGKYATYSDYKASADFDRQFVIQTASIARERFGDQVFVNKCMDSDAWRKAKVVIFDNIGLIGEHLWAVVIGRPYLLLRIETPFNMEEPDKSRMRQLPGKNWLGDSREPFDYKHMLSAYDSQQMSLLLDWLVDGKNDKESGPYHEYREFWRRHFAAG